MKQSILSIFSWPLLLRMALPPWIVLGLDVAGGSLGLHYYWSNFDAYMHFLGGLSIALSVVFAWRALVADGHVGQTAWPIRMIAMVGTVMIVAIAWEWLEFFADLRFGTHLQPNVADTMADFFFGMMGAVVGSLLSFCRRPHRLV